MTDNNLRKNIIWNAAGNIIYLGTQWLITVLVANIGGLEDAGILSVAMSVSSSFQTVALFGMRNFQVSDVENKYSEACYMFTRFLTCVASPMLCLSFALIMGYRGVKLGGIMLFMLFRIAESYSDALHGIAQKNDRLDIAGKSFAIKGAGLLVFFLGGYMLTSHLNVGLAAMAIFSAASTLIYDLNAVRRVTNFKLYDTPVYSLKLIIECMPLFAYMFLSVALTVVPKLFLENMLGDVVLGAYSSIFAPVLLLQTACGYVYSPFVSSFARLKRENDNVGFLKLLSKISIIIVAALGAVFVAAQFLGEWAMLLLYHENEEIADYIGLLNPILICNIVLSLMGFLTMVVVVLRKMKYILISYGVGFLICIAASYPAIKLFDAAGAAYSIIAAALAISLIQLIPIISENRGEKLL